MLFVFNKNKIISYAIAASVVVVLFLFSTLLMPQSEIELVPASTETTNELKNATDLNHMQQKRGY